MQTFGRVMAKSMDALTLMAFFVFLGALIFGSMIFYAEGGEWDPVRQEYLRPNKSGEGHCICTRKITLASQRTPNELSQADKVRTTPLPPLFF